jgi:predicted hydrolase (HD superfamily)
MRKKSNYKPKGVRLDNMAWVQSSLKKVGTLPTAGLALKLKMHEALAAMLNGTATRSDVDALISAVNVAEALIKVRADLGRDWAVEIKAAQDAIHDMGVRCYKRDKFLFTGPEMSAVKVVVELHDQQLDDCTVREMEQALFIVDEVIRMKMARAIIPADKQTA